MVVIEYKCSNSTIGLDYSICSDQKVFVDIDCLSDQKDIDSQNTPTNYSLQSSIDYSIKHFTNYHSIGYQTRMVTNCQVKHSIYSSINH